jgi:acetyl-CoA carboxylase biotin carboxyl carrier protein
MTRIAARDVEALIEVFESSEWQELRLEVDGFTIELSKRTGTRRITESARTTWSSVPARAAPSEVLIGPEADKARGAQTTKNSEVPSGSLAVRAPSMGTFYRAAKPGEPPFVEVGTLVEPRTELCLIEVMKLFTAVCAGSSGRVREIRVSDGETVEQDQILFVIEPPP